MWSFGVKTKKEFYGILTGDLILCPGLINLFVLSDGEPQSFPTNLVVTVAVSGVAALAIICATAYLVVRSCSKRRQRGDLNVAT